MKSRKEIEEWSENCESIKHEFQPLLGQLEKYLSQIDIEQIKEFVNEANEFGVGLEWARDCILSEELNIPKSVYDKMIQLRNRMNLMEDEDRWDTLKEKVYKE